MKTEPSIDIVIAYDLVKHFYADRFCRTHLEFEFDFDRELDRMSHIDSADISVSTSPGLIFTQSIHPHPRIIKSPYFGVVIKDGAIGISTSFQGLGRTSTIVKRLMDYQYQIKESTGSTVMHYRCYDYMIDLHDLDYKQKHLIYLKRAINIIQEEHSRTSNPLDLW